MGSFQLNNETIAIVGLIVLGICACFVPNGQNVLPIATGLLGYIKGKDDAKQISQAA